MSIFLRSCAVAAALASVASAQTTLVANTSNNNGLTAGTPGLFFDLTAGANALTVTHLTTASNRAPGVTFDIEVFTFVGSGLGGPVGSGPGSSPAGWTSLGVATATAAPVAGQQTWPSAEATVDALLMAVVSGDRRELRPLFGVRTDQIAPIRDDATMGEVASNTQQMAQDPGRVHVVGSL
jgi:hypothetical protein